MIFSGLSANENCVKIPVLKVCSTLAEENFIHHLVLCVCVCVLLAIWITISGEGQRLLDVFNQLFSNKQPFSTSAQISFEAEATVIIIIMAAKLLAWESAN